MRICPRSTMFLAATAALCVTGCTTSYRNALAEECQQRSICRFDDKTGEMYRTYQYFPSAEVYRNVFHRTWYWHEDGQTFHGSQLPASAASRVNENCFEFVFLPTVHPFEMHAQVTEQFPTLETLTIQAAAFQSEDAFDQVANVPDEE